MIICKIRPVFFLKIDRILNCKPSWINRQPFWNTSISAKSWKFNSKILENGVS